MASISEIVLAKANAAVTNAEAESWLLTCKTMFPQSFKIQMLCYEIQCKNANVAGAADCLTQMYVYFKGEDQFWSQVTSLVLPMVQLHYAKDEETLFKKHVFESLLPALQQQLLLDLADRATDKTLQCDLLLFLFRQFSESIAIFGLQLIDVLTLLEAETSGTSGKRTDSPGDISNEYLLLQICEVLPAVLQNSEVPISSSTSLKLLERAISFFIIFLSSVDPNGVEKFCKQCKLAHCETVLSNPIESLKKIYDSVASRLKWSAALVLKDLGLESMVSCLKHLADVDSDEARYTALLLLIASSHSYCNLIGQSTLNEADDNLFERRMVVLLPAATSGTQLTPFNAIDLSTSDPSKRFRCSDQTEKECCLSLQQLHILFALAEGCFNIIDQENLLRLFSKTPLSLQDSRKQRKPEDGEVSFLSIFFAKSSGVSTESSDLSFPRFIWQFILDAVLWRGCFDEFVRSAKVLDSKYLVQLQLAGCFYAIKELGAAAEEIARAMSSNSIKRLMIDEKQTTKFHAMPVCISSSDNFARNQQHVRLVCCSATSCVAYAAEILLSCLERKSLLLVPTDETMGHIIVLSQVNVKQFWPLCRDMLDIIWRKKSFDWPGLLDYIERMEILEEFAYLNCAKVTDDHHVNLRLFDSSANHKGLPGTRNYSKSSKEENKLCIDEAAKRKGRNIETVLHEFMITKIDSIWAFLLDS